MKILVVDDERFIRNSLKEILTDEGYEVEVAEDGSAALELLGKGHYDVVFCDIKMPGKDGNEVLDYVCSEGCLSGRKCAHCEKLSTTTSM